MGRAGGSVGAIVVLVLVVFIASALPVRTEAASSPGSQARIVFTSNRDGNSEIYVMNADGSGQRRLTRNPKAPTDGEWCEPCTDEFGVLSPDGRKIAFSSYRDSTYADDVPEIYVMNADGSGQRRLTRNKGGGFPVWSPNGRRIAFISQPDYSEGEVYVMNADGSGQRNLTRDAADDQSPTWSPDGRKIAFERDGDSFEEIFVMNADGSDQSRLTHKFGSDIFPVWSPSGRKIAFTSPGSGGYENVFVMNADGSDQRNLTQTPAAHDSTGVSDPTTRFAGAWSPNGRRLAFTSERDGNTEVYVMNADGSGQRNLTQDPADDIVGTWSSDGRRIVFTSNRDGNSEVYSMNADGSGQRNLTQNAADDGLGTALVAYPDASTPWGFIVGVKSTCAIF